METGYIMSWYILLARRQMSEKPIPTYGIQTMVVGVTLYKGTDGAMESK